MEEKRNQGINVFLEIEVNGAAQVMSRVKDDRVISFFLMPPSLKTLESRIRGRKTESNDVIEKRLEKGKREMSMSKHYDFVVINDRVDRAANRIISIIKKKL